MGIQGHWSIFSLYFFALSFCFSPPPGSSPFLLSTLSYATSLPQPSSHPPNIPAHPCTSLYIPTHSVAASKQSAAGHGLPTQKGAAEIFPPVFPFSIAIRKLAADKGSVLAPGIKQWPKSRGSPCSPNKHNLL